MRSTVVCGALLPFTSSRRYSSDSNLVRRKLVDKAVEYIVSQPDAN